jgi:regulator of cell morphogenesis and NO signaling
MTINETTTVAAIAATVPSSVRVFQRHGIDFCCGGRKPIGEACREQGVSLADVTREIDSEQNRPSGEQDWSHRTLTALIDHVVATYHAPLRAELPRLEGMAAKAAAAHGDKAPHLRRVCDVVGELADDLRAHMQKEEQVQFPTIRELEDGDATLPVPLTAAITVMEEEHDSAGALLAELRALTNGYVAPPWACRTFQALYQGLAELESEMHVHVHLENNILFPRVSALSR